MKTRPPWGVCMRCGFKRRVNQLKLERHTNLRVCRECWDPVPEERKPPRVTPEGVPVPNASPEPAPVEAAHSGDWWAEERALPSSGFGNDDL